MPHTKGQYVKDNYHTNSIEGFWSLLKRGILGIYHSGKFKIFTAMVSLTWKNPSTLF